MLHSIIHWPDVTGVPVSATCDLPTQYMPNPQTGVSYMTSLPESFKTAKVHDLRLDVRFTVLDMHDGKKLPRWKPRSHRTRTLG
jgi:hypothetical protein